MVDVVSTVSGIQSQASSASASLSANFDTFLNLLTAQLQNQDPLEPVDSSEFTNQLVQFSGVEQQIQTNQNMAKLIQLTNNSTVAGLSGYLGQIVEIDSLVGELGADGIEWRYDMPEGVKGAKVSIQDQRGNVIYSQELSTTEGTASFEWNGETTNGADREDGFYQMIIQATDSSGEAVNVPARVRAQVSGIDLTTDQTAISTTAGAFYFDQVLRLAAAS